MFSHVTLESCFGSSCSHALFAKRPSRTFESGRKTISIPVFGAGAGAAVEAGAAGGAAPVSIDVPWTKPSCNALRQNESKPLKALPLRARRLADCAVNASVQCAFTRSTAEDAGPPLS